MAYWAETTLHYGIFTEKLWEPLL